MSKKTTVGLSLLIIVVAVGALLTVTDLGTGVVKDQAARILSQVLAAKVSLGGVSGNPLKGYDIRDLEIEKDGAYSFAVPSVEVRTNLLGILGKGALVDRITLLGVTTDVGEINSLIDGLPESKGEGPSSLPIKTVELKDSSLKLPEGDLKIAKLLAKLDLDDVLDVDLSMELSYLGLPVKGDVSISYGESMLTVKSSKLSVGSGTIAVKGDLLPDMAAKGTLDGLKLEDFAPLWPRLAEIGISGKASAAFTAGGSLTEPDLSGTVAFDGKVTSVPIAGLEGSWRYQDMSMEVSSFKADVAGVPLSGRLSALFGPDKPKVDIKMDASGADLGKLRAVYPRIPKEVSGVIDSVAVALSGPMDGLDGTVKAKADSLSVWGQSLSQSWVSLSLGSKGIAKISAKTVLKGQPAYLEGSVSFSGGSPKADLILKARKVPMGLVASLTGGKIPVDGELDLDMVVKGPLSGPSIGGTVSSPSLSGFGQTIENPSVGFVLRGTDLEIASAGADWCGASLSASGSLSVGGASPKVSLKGRMKGLDMTKVGSSFKLPGGMVSGALDGSFALDGDVASPSIGLGMSSGKLSLSGIPVNNLNLELTGDMTGFKISKGSAELAGGSVEASGSVVLGDSPAVDLALEGSGIGLGSLVDLPIRATLSGTVRAKGPFASPDVSMAFSSPKVTAWGVGIDGISASMTLGGGIVTLKEAVASVGGSPLSLKGSLDTSGSVPKGDFELSGPDLDLSKAAKGMVDADAYGIGGKLSVAFKGTFEGDRGDGTGYIKSPSFKVMNVVMKDLSCPLKLAGTRLNFAEATADLYGGAVKSSGWLDLKTMEFSKKVSVSGTDVSPLIKDFAGTKGTVTGIAKAGFSASGRLSPFSMKGDGVLDLGGGKLVGFPIADMAASLYGSGGISYAKGHGEFHVVDTVLNLDKGTLVTARDGDPIYRTIAVVGSVGPNRKLDLSCSGEVNVKLLNAAVGAGVGGISGGGVGTLAAVVGGVLGGAQQGMLKDDFRDVSFRVTGTIDSSSVRDLKVGPSKIVQETSEPSSSDGVLQVVPGVDVTTVSDDVQGTEEPKKLEDHLKDALEQEAGKLLEGILGGGKKN